jgi:hypothetical protein
MRINNHGPVVVIVAALNSFGIAAEQRPAATDLMHPAVPAGTTHPAGSNSRN